MNTKRDQIIRQLAACGFERLNTTGSTWASFRYGWERNSINVDVGPRGATTCWVVTIPFTGTAISKRLSLDDALERANMR